MDENREGCRENGKQAIRLDGSNRVALRNRRFLRKILPVVDTPNYTPQESQPLIQRQMPIDCETPCIEPEMMEVVDTDVDRGMADHTDMEVEENQHPIVQPPPSPVLRRSTRIIRPPRSLSPQMRGPAHYYSESSQQATTKHMYCGHRRGWTCRVGSTIVDRVRPLE